MKIKITVDCITGLKKGDVISVIGKQKHGYIVKQTDEFFKSQGFCKLVLNNQAIEL